MSITEAAPATIANLWQRLRSMMTRASFVVGPLSALAALASLTRRRQREIASCITRLEAIARKLILVAAVELRRAERDGAKASRMPQLKIVTPSPTIWRAGLRPASPAEAKSRCAPGGARSNLLAFDPSHPETWRVRFKLAPPRDEEAVPESRAPHSRPMGSNARAAAKRLVSTARFCARTNAPGSTFRSAAPRHRRSHAARPPPGAHPAASMSKIFQRR